MKAVLQRVKSASVVAGSAGSSEATVVGRIEMGLLVYVGVGVRDTAAQAEKLADKVAGLRIFRDDHDQMNLSVRDVGGEVLVIPNFTLMADARKGRRPAFINAARPEQAEVLYEKFMASLADRGVRVAGGKFRAHMVITSEACGPVNILLDISAAPLPGEQGAPKK